MASVVQSIRGEFARYKALAEGAIAQLSDDQLSASASIHDNSIAVIVWHLSGNFASRFTDFLTTDGEKPDRHRDEEFVARQVTRAELLEHWERGWRILFDALAGLDDSALGRTVTIRSQPLLVHEALHRSLAHASYHVGQIVFVAKAGRGDAWTSLSIPRGQSAIYNQNPGSERPSAHADRLTKKS